MYLLSKFLISIYNFLLDKQELLIKNAELSQKYELLKLLNNKQQQQQQQSQPPMAPKESTESNDTNNTNEIRSLKEELNEKDKLIKNLTQRLNDMRKTLTKELKCQMLPNELPANHAATSSKSHQQQQQQQANDVAAAKSHVESSKAGGGSQRKSLTHQQISLSSSSFHHPTTTNNTPPKRLGSTSTAATNLSNLHDDVNFKYLKHVVLKFITSREYEVRDSYR